MADGERVVAIPAHDAFCVAASSDGRWIAAGTLSRKVFVWGATTYEQAFAGNTGSDIYDVDFSPDSTRLVSASYNLGTAIIWDVATWRNVRTLSHRSFTYSTRYSPQGDRIATAGPDSVRIWDSNDGCLLVDIKVQVTYTNCLFWCKNNLFVRTDDGKIWRIDAATGSTISEWPVPYAPWPCIALLQHGKFIACSAEKAITIWDTTTQSQLSLIQLTHDVRSIACASNGELLAIGGQGKVIVKELFQPVSVCSMLCLQSTFTASHFHHTFRNQNFKSYLLFNPVWSRYIVSRLQSIFLYLGLPGART